MPKLPRRKCKVCNEWFHPAYDNIRWCCPEHGAQFGLQQLEKKLVKQRVEKEKAERGEWRKRKAAVKPLKHWEDMTQRVVNDYIREPETEINGGGALPVVVKVVGCISETTWPERLLSSKSGCRCFAAD